MVEDYHLGSDRGRVTRSLRLLAVVAVAGVLLGLALSFALARRDFVPEFREQTRARFQELKRSFDSINFPTSFKFIAREEVGSAYPTEYPTELRMYAVGPAALSELRATLTAQGWVVDEGSRTACSVEARLNGYRLSVDLLDGVKKSEPSCPDLAAKRRFAELRLYREG